MSFTVTMRGRRGRGLGTGPFISEMTARAGVAIGEAVRSGRGIVAERRLEEVPPSTEITPVDNPPMEASALDCGCLAKRGTEALVNLGMDPGSVSIADAIAECEADPAAFFSAIAGFFPDGAIPPCAWYESPTTRNKYLLIGTGALLLVAGGVYVARR